MSRFLNLLALSLTACQPREAPCEAALDVVGTYACTGQCVVTNGGKGYSLVEVTGETDKISLFDGSPPGRLYQVEITGQGGFRELEIGALTGEVLRAATAQVSDGHYPVLEDYVFERDAQCRAHRYTKTVRNPTLEQFKSCVLVCTR